MDAVQGNSDSAKGGFVFCARYWLTDVGQPMPGDGIKQRHSSCPEAQKNLHPAMEQLYLRPLRAEERILKSGSFDPGPNFDFIRVNRRGSVRFLPQ